ncbi:MAG: hypothetical protein K9N55_06200 [Phycisphaerae bacterium]|nr:hypothetical protein [Phycisphaerae bacterium]
MDAKALEKYSSAITLSDMEIFVFPELMYSLVLANIMSPIIWQWREASCFKKLQGKSQYRKLMRLKQFIMDEFDFNLDLETWGLTDRHKEVDRFSPFITPEQISQSNALFGYHGDQYYFDVDIRRHFGLDKYDSDIIPYWKTETIEAMKAFELKEDYGKAAGECVSLAALYAAAAFIVCDIPLEDIFMILTPLHSQNFLDMQDGVLTNNRRLVTKTMWFNGTEISNKAQRALKNERVTMVSHISGHIHCLYDHATIDQAAYTRFSTQLNAYLATELNLQLFANFLRTFSQYQKHFQVCRNCHGQAQFLKAEVLFHYEHGSHFRVADETFDKLLEEVSDEDYIHYELPDRVRCDRLHTFLSKHIDLQKLADRNRLVAFLSPVIPDAETLVDELVRFVHTQAKLPDSEKQFSRVAPILLTPGMDRQAIIEAITSKRTSNPVADLAVYAYRDMDQCDWEPFVKAAFVRNPVSVDRARDMSIEQVYAWLLGMHNKSIYDGNRLAQPDEVVNFKTGDGIEKAFVLANIAHHRGILDQPIELVISTQRALVTAGEVFCFPTKKTLKKTVVVHADGKMDVT